METHAVGLLHAISTALAHAFVDHEAFRRLRQFSARPHAPLFGRTLLVVHDHSDAFYLFGLTQHGGQFEAVANVGIFRPLGVVGIVILRQYEDLTYAHGFEHPGYGWRVDRIG